jgi:hypothetical protein
MALRLGELLVNEKLITREHLEEALQAQVIFGGKLGTIMIEMGLLSEKTMTGALKQLLGFPCAQPEDLEDIPRNVIEIISLELAEKHMVIPVAVSGRKLTLAMADPRDIQAIDEISFRTGYIILPMLSLEVRLYFALERYYGIKRPIRYIAPPKHVRDELDQLQIIKGSGKAEPAHKEEEYLGTPGSEHVHVPVKEPVKTPPAAPPPVEEEELEEVEEIHVSLEDMARRLVAAGNRDDVADALVEYLGAHYARAVLFMVVAGQVTGWRAVKNHQPIPSIDQFQLPLSEPSVLKTAVESNSFFLGPVSPSGANLALTTLLGKPAPTTAVLLPLAMLGRVVGLIYVDDPAVSMSEAVLGIQKAAGKALLAFELLILHSKILRT